MTKYLRLDEPPTYSVTYTCDACLIELEIDSDGPSCSSCGTEWDWHNLDKGVLPEESEMADTPAVSLSDAWIFSNLSGDERDTAVREWLGKQK